MRSRTALIWGVVVIVFLILLALSLRPVQAAPCAERDQILSAAKQHYHEEPYFVGRTKGTNMLFEMLLSPEGSWTFVVTNVAQHITCILASGVGWEELPHGRKV